MSKNRFSMDELKELYPDKWVILDDCEWENRSTVKTGVLVAVCEDEDISNVRMKNRHEGKTYYYQRTSEGLISPYIHALNYEVRT